MATRSRDSAPGKEKKGTSPSNVPHTGTTLHRKTPNTTTTTSPARSSNPTAHVPNYLKATLSSGPDVSKQQGKKTVTSDATHSLARRRSFDVPPSFNSRTPTSRVSPNPTPRSSSFTVRAGASHKPVQDKTSKGAKDVGKQRNLYARPATSVKMKTIYVKKQVTSEQSGSSTAKENVTTPPEKVGEPIAHDVHEPEKEVKDQEESVLIAEAEEQKETEGINDGIIKNDQAPVIKEDHQEVMNVEKTEPERNKDSKTETVESPKVLEKHHTTSPVVEPDEKPPQIEEETIIKQQDLEHITNETTNSTITDEIVPNTEVEHKEGNEATTLDKKEEKAVETESNEKEVVQAKEEKKRSQRVVPVQAKKDSALSNDVIEETASKLREQRKNKVRALAGAFETVISLQDP